MPICIYCKATKPPGEFPKEHVLTRAFCGAGENWTLLDTVCADCNRLFSGWESEWCRSGIEGLIRTFKGPLGRRSGSAGKRRQPLESDHLYMVQSNDDLVYEAGLAYPGDPYFRPQLVQTDDGLVALVAEREDIRLLDVIDDMVKKGTFDVCKPIDSESGRAL